MNLLLPQPGNDDEDGLPEGIWLGGQFLGKGGDGTIHVWFLVDDTNTIRDRIVIKDMWSKASTEEPTTYQGIYDDLVRKGLDFGVDPSRPGKALEHERFLKEAYIQGFLTDNSGSSSANTVPLRGFKRGTHSDHVKGTHWRMYMDWLHASDLGKFVARHGVQDKDVFKLRPIPEAFIWWTLSCLAEALVQIDQRTKTRAKARKERDETIVLVDMKPANILLDSTRGSRYPVYPKPLIADFGSAHITYKDDPANVRGELKIFDTRGFITPEQAYYDDTSLGPGECLNSWTNVWQTGRIIETMMRLTDVVKENEWEDEEDEERESEIKTDPPSFDWFPDFEYSKELKEIVWRCQRFDPPLRPTPAEIVDYIDQHAPNHNGGMDTWGTEAWIAEQELALADLSDEARKTLDDRAQQRSGRSELNFLHNYADINLRDRYVALDLDIPAGCELAYQGIADSGRIGTRVSDSEDEEEDNGDIVMEDEEGDEDDDEDIPDVYDEDEDDYDN